MMVLLGIVICLLISGMFSGMEAGILSINRVRLRHQVKLRGAVAIRLNRLLSHPERLLVTVLLVTNFMNICAVALGTRSLTRWLGMWGYVAAFVIWLPVWLAVDLLPKSFFRRFPYRALASLTGVLGLADTLLSPVLWVGSKLHGIFFARREHGIKRIFTAREDFKYLVAEHARTGALEGPEVAMINHVIDFHEVTARDVMWPMAGMMCVNENASVQELLAAARESHYDQFPVKSESGEVVGLVNVFDVLIDIRNGDGKVGAYMRRLVSVPPREPAFSVLRKLRAAHGNLAVVMDPQAGAVGVASTESLIKRLMGTES